MKSALSASATNTRYNTAPRTAAAVMTTSRRELNRLSPTMTAARPMTMVPMPIEMSDTPCDCANKAPPSAHSALDRARPANTMAPVATPCARAMRGFEPVARNASPACVARYQSSANLTAATTTRTSSGRRTWSGMASPVNSENTVGSVISGTLGRPMILRLTEYSAIIIRMPASRSMILSLTLSHPVIAPASAPASVATSVAEKGSQPATISVAATAAPSGKLPSTVRSGKRSIRKEINTPNATRPHMRPNSSAPHNAYQDMNGRSLLDDLRGGLAQLAGKCDALLARRRRVQVQGEPVAGFRGNVAGLFALQDAHHHAAGLAAHFVVVQAQRRRCSA